MTELQTIIWTLKQAIRQGGAVLRRLLEEEEKGPKHEWVHGDVFKNSAGVQIYLEPNGGPTVTNLEHTGSKGTPEVQLSGSNVDFLFNIKEKLQ